VGATWVDASDVGSAAQATTVCDINAVAAMPDAINTIAALFEKVGMNSSEIDIHSLIIPRADRWPNSEVGAFG
jgi:hypothetical protein